MALTYGVLKGKIVSDPVLKASRRKNETKYHLHASLQIESSGGARETWDTAINVGTNDADDLLKYKLIYDFRSSFLDTLRQSPSGFSDLTGEPQVPAVDFLRGSLLEGTGPWRDSGVMDGTETPEPVASFKRLLLKAHATGSDVYIFGRAYTDGARGIHDVHMNQGSQSASFLNNGQDDHNDHNDIWQDGAILVDDAQPEWAAYFTAFTQQLVLTDNLGNPSGQSRPISD